MIDYSKENTLVEGFIKKKQILRVSGLESNTRLVPERLLEVLDTTGYRRLVRPLVRCRWRIRLATGFHDRAGELSLYSSLCKSGA